MSKVAIIRTDVDLVSNITTEPVKFRIYGTMGRYTPVDMSMNPDGVNFDVVVFKEPLERKTLTQEELLNEFNPHIKASKLVMFNKG